jgi:hypothetical protein
MIIDNRQIRITANHLDDFAQAVGQAQRKTSLEAVEKRIVAGNPGDAFYIREFEHVESRNQFKCFLGSVVH